jgi:uncharacterized protein (TIGR01777 family)
MAGASPAIAGLRVAVTGATGLIGRRLVAELLAAGARVTVLSRDPDRARRSLPGVEAFAWEPQSQPAPVEALDGRDAVVNLAGETVAQRWDRRAKAEVRDSRVVGTRNLLEGMRRLQQPPRAIVAASGTGYYGARGEEPIDEEAPPGDDFLARVCVEWEAEAERAAALGTRVAVLRTGVVLDASGGALAAMLPAFRLGLGGPVAGGRQYVPWIHAEDVVGMYVAALAREEWSGPLNATAPSPATNRELSRALGRALRRPASLPIPAAVLRARYGEMAQVVTTGVRAVPARALVLGYEFRHPDLDGALRAALGG